MTETDKPKTLTFGGRSFIALDNPTIERDFWLMREVRAAGLAELVIADGEAAEAFAQRTLDAVIASGKAFLLLGAFLVPEGTSPQGWTPALAAETAGFLAKLNDPEDKRQVQVQVLSLLTGFLARGLSSLTTTAASSGAETNAGPENSDMVN